MAKNDPRNIETTRTKALNWWHSLMTIGKVSKCSKYFPNRLEHTLTDREIEQIYTIEFTNKTYYQNQLNRIETMADFAPSLKIKDGKNETKWLYMNPEMIQDLVNWIDEKYCIKSNL